MEASVLQGHPLKLHKLSDLKVIFLAVKELHNLCPDKIVLIATENNTVIACKQGRKHGVRPTVCCTMENADLVLKKTDYSQGPIFNAS